MLHPAKPGGQERREERASESLARLWSRLLGSGAPEAGQGGFDDAPIPLVVVAFDGRILRVNQAFCHLVGRTKGALLASTWGDLEAPPPPEEGPWRGAHPRETRLRRGETGEFLAAFRSAVVRGPEDRSCCSVVVVEDVTDSRRELEALREEVRCLVAERGAFEEKLAFLVHDLASPLRVVVAMAQLLRSRARGLDAPLAELLGRIEGAAGRLKNRVNGFLDEFRASRERPEFEPVALEDVLAEVRSDLAWAIEAAGAELTHDPLPVVTGLRPSFRSILQNLVENAIKYRGEEPPRIHVGAAETGEDWTLFVRDNGRWMSREEARDLFEVFHREGRGDVPGHGLGLASCRRHVARHGGGIRVESAPGRGSTFIVSLPRSTERRTP